MRRLLPTVLAAAIATAALAPSLALAKGPVEASLEGPGLDEPIVVRAEGEYGLAPEAPLMQLAESVGFFPAAFGRASWDDGDPRTEDVDPMLSRRPKGELGPRYLVTYTVPGPEGVVDELTQHLYPYATAGLVSYMPPGQPFFGWRKTAGGWFVATPDAKRVLLAAGLPERPPAPTAPDGSGFPWALAGGLAALGAALAAGVGTVVVRRRPQTA